MQELPHTIHTHLKRYVTLLINYRYQVISSLFPQAVALTSFHPLCKVLLPRGHPPYIVSQSTAQFSSYSAWKARVGTKMAYLAKR